MAERKRSRAHAQAVSDKGETAHKGKHKRPVEVVVRTVLLRPVPETEVFMLRDGRKLSNMHELIGALEDMTDEVFSYHVNAMKNDFATWVNNALKEEDLAKDIKGMKNRLETQAKIMKNLIGRLTRGD